MIRRIKSWLFTFNMTVLLTFNLFVITAVVLGLVALLAWIGMELGLLDMGQLLQPGYVIAVIYIICILIGVSVAMTIQRVILRPVRRMVSAM